MSASNHPKPELSQPAVKPCEPSEPLNPDINTTLTVAGISFSKEKMQAILSYSGNIAVCAGVTTIAVAGVKLPSDYILQRLTLQNLKLKSSDIKLSALYSGGATFIRFGMPRSCYCIHSKQQVAVSGKAHESRAVVEEKAVVEETSFESISKRMLDVALLSGGETLLTHIPDHKTSLAQQKKIYTNNIHNFWAMSQAGVGIRFTSSGFNLVCLTSLNDHILKRMIKDSKPTPTENFIAGAISGFIAGIISYPLKQLQTQINVSAEIRDKQLFYPPTHALIAKNLEDLEHKPFRVTVSEAAPKLFIRSSQTALLFAMINGVNFILGSTPASDLYQFVQERSQRPK